ncbi:MAG: energy-dependent translational throttle protein EttA [Candidatus Sumerlaeaceae bacterium]|nr:energy-dependent translational throttle protein EttA [Candidatus Sumerlaeaceae bacterium]
MAEQFIFTIYKLNKYYGTRQVLKNINLCFYPGAKIGIVGDNGSGKSTLLKIMAGLDQDFQGTAEPARKVRVGFVPQEPHLDPTKNVRQNLEMAFAETVELLKEYDEVTASLGELDGDAMDKAMNRMAVLQDRIEAVDGWNLDRTLDVASNALVLPPDDMDVTKLSGGERRRVALAKVLLEKPEMLLLDEPTNHLDAETIDWLEEQLKDYPGTVIIATHDRYFLDNVTKWILELESGEGIPFEGNYSSWLAQKLEILAKNEKSKSPRRKSLEAELRWIKMNVSEHHDLTRSRLMDLEQFVSKERDAEDTTAIQIAPAEHLGDQVIEVHNVTKGYGGQPLVENVEFILPKGAIVGIIGPNGTGKTTLFRMITGQEKPDSGEIVIGPTVHLAHVDQHRDALSDEKTLFDEISEGKTEIPFGKQSIPARLYVGRFNFKGTDQQKLVKNLSGGERNRVLLAKLLKSGANVLLLDEPTNDLDVGTLRMLEDAINGFGGCVLVISHDRFFLNRICTHILAFEGESKVKWFEGNYEEYEAARRRELGDAAVENRRSRYRKLVKA